MNFLNLSEPFRIINHTLLKNGEAIGIINPSLVFVHDDKLNTFKLIGPGGGVDVKVNDSNEIIKALIVTKSVLLGNSDVVYAVQKLLMSDYTSRTASYVVNLSNSCEGVCEYFRKVLKSSIAVVGCGGIGSLSAMILAGAGIRHLTLVDHDIIELSNLNRQFVWTRNEIGLFKVDVLKSALEARFDDMKIDVIKQAVDSSSLAIAIKSSDAVLLSADEPVGFVYDARRIAAATNKVFVSGGYTLNEAVLSTSSAHRAENAKTIKMLPNSIAPSFGPTNVEIAGAATAYLLLCLGGLINETLADVAWKIDQWPWRKD